MTTRHKYGKYSISETETQIQKFCCSNALSINLIHRVQDTLLPKFFSAMVSAPVTVTHRR